MATAGRGVCDHAEEDRGDERWSPELGAKNRKHKPDDEGAIGNTPGRGRGRGGVLGSIVIALRITWGSSSSR